MGAAIKTILIIDDDKEVLDITKVRLQKHGYRVLVAQSGEEGLIQAYQEKPNLILLDITMPGKDGFAVLKELKGSDVTWNIPIFMLTAKSETSSMIDSQNCRATDYFIKPFNWEELLRNIKKSIEMTSESGLSL
jgi:DNA-binding response OmpR family regulator